MIAMGIDDYTVMAICGHSSTRMLARYTHLTEMRKLDALETFVAVSDGQNVGRTENADAKKAGGPHGARTHDLRVANAQEEEGVSRYLSMRYKYVGVAA